MTRSLFLLLVLWLLPSAAFGQGAVTQGAACPRFFPGGQSPGLLNARLASRTTLLCNGFFATLASGVTRGPLWSAERLTAGSVAQAREIPRQGEFHPDDRLPEDGRAELADYRRSGYDRGHMAPSGDMPDPATQQESFSLANMVPQAGELNRGVWADIEMAVRTMAARRGELFVVTGPAFTAGTVNAVGPNDVLVPTAVWKAVYVPGQGVAGAYFCTNVDATQCRTMAVAELARITGVDPFPAVPPGVKAVAMALPIPNAGSTGRHRRPRGPRPGLEATGAFP